MPITEDKITFIIYLEGLSDGEPIRIIEKGTYDVLELWVNVSIKTTDNVVFHETQLNKSIKVIVMITS